MTGHTIPATLTAASWLLTYAVHSTVLLGLAGLIGKLLGTRRLALQELVWRAAVVGGLLTTSLQIGLGVGGAFDISAVAMPATPAAVESTSALAPGGPAATLGQPARQAEAPAHVGTSMPWPALLVILWLAGSAVSVVRVGRASLDLRRLLADRLPVSGGPLAAALTRLLRLLPERPHVALSSSRALPIPIAVGIRCPEICVPERALGELPPAQQEGLCAHELAHLVRRDPVWSLVLAVIDGVLFFQPLNRVARRRLGEIAEFRCDDWAAISTGRRHDLARCLATVAEWGHASERCPLPAVSLLGSSRLARRVRRLVSGDGDLDRIGRPHGAAVAAGALLLGLGMVLPGVGLARSSSTAIDQQPPVEAAPVLPVPAAAPAPAPVPEPAPVHIVTEKKPKERRLQKTEEQQRAKAKHGLDEATAAEMERLEAEIESLSQEIQQRTQHIEQMHIPFEEQRREFEEQRRQFEEQQKIHEEMAHKMEQEIRALEVSEVDTTRLEAEIQRLGEKLEQARLENASPAQEARIRKEIELHVQEMVSKKMPSEEALKRIRKKAQETAEAMEPTKEQMHQFAEQAKALAEEMRPEREEIRKLSERIRERAERLRKLARAAAERKRASRPSEPPASPQAPVPPAPAEAPSGAGGGAGNAP